MTKGWIAIHRKLQECDIWTSDQPFDMRSAWIDLLMFANHEDKQIIFDYKPIIVKRGQYLTSVRKLSARWKWDKERTLKYLRLLEQLGMITKDSNNRRTLLTIENYEKYQDWQDTEPPTTPYTRRTQDGHSTATNNNENNENNENNKYSSSFVTFWDCYPKKSDKGQAYKCYKARLNDGWSEEELLIACQNYAAECKKDKRETRYIKNGSTFLSSTTPFTDYLKKGGSDIGRVTGDTRSDEERIAEEQVRRIESGEEEDERPFADMPKVSG